MQINNNNLIFERILFMKKIAYIVSAISAGLFSQAANADISVSGSGSCAYTDAGGNTSTTMGGGVSFAMSTTTDGGVTISGSAGISLDNILLTIIRFNWCKHVNFRFCKRIYHSW